MSHSGGLFTYSDFTSNRILLFLQVMTQIGSLRLVSLLPSATEIIACLGLTERLVGISHECDYPPEIKNRSICTSARLSTQQPSGEIHREVDKLLAAAASIYEIDNPQVCNYGHHGKGWMSMGEQF
jgi:hypothetical protein